MKQNPKEGRDTDLIVMNHEELGKSYTMYEPKKSSDVNKNLDFPWSRAFDEFLRNIEIYEKNSHNYISNRFITKWEYFSQSFIR